MNILKKVVHQIYHRFGILVITKKSLKNNDLIRIKTDYNLSDSNITYIKARGNSGLAKKLSDEKKTRWLEIGCGGTFEENFTYIDLFPETLFENNHKYFRIDITNISDSDREKLGKFDLIRMQHVFEHFTPEDGQKVLLTCSKLLNKDGYLLISVPDLKKYIDLYLSGKIKNNFDWALKRIKEDSPNSYYFSIFSHSLNFEEHKWCYDAEGLIYQLEQTNQYKNIQELTLNDELANIPFTHNRPNEDVCVIAQAK